MVSPLNSFGFSSFMLFYVQFLLTNVVYICVTSGIIYMGIVKNSIDSLAH